MVAITDVTKTRASLFSMYCSLCRCVSATSYSRVAVIHASVDNAASDGVRNVTKESERQCGTAPICENYTSEQQYGSHMIDFGPLLPQESSMFQTFQCGT